MAVAWDRNGMAWAGASPRLIMPRSMWASNSLRNRLTAEAVGAVADGPSGQMVVCLGGQTSPPKPRRWTVWP